MEVSPLAAVLLAAAGAFVLSLGNTLQKRHVGWIGRTPRMGLKRLVGPDRRRPGRFSRDFSLWFLGFVLVNIVPVFNYVALLGLPANVVGAGAGLSVAFTTILAKLMLKEKLGSGRLGWTLLLFGAIAAAGFLGSSGGSGEAGLSRLALLLFFFAPLAAGIVVVVFRGKLEGPRHATILAAISGALGGFMIFPLRALQIDAGVGLSGWLASPYLYLYLGAGIASFVLVQLAYKDGELASVAPALYGMQVLWPALATHFIFGAEFNPAQTAAFLLVAICVAFIAGIKPPPR
jgi:Protein of unknown function (DUF803).